MKTLFKSVIKWVYIIIIPTIVLVTCVNYFYTFGWSGWSTATLWSAIVISAILNALFYLSILSTTWFLPKVKVEYVSMIGFCVGIPPSRPFQLLILLPFCTIEISKRTKGRK